MVRVLAFNMAKVETGTSKGSESYYSRPQYEYVRPSPSDEAIIGFDLRLNEQIRKKQAAEAEAEKKNGSDQDSSTHG